MFVDRKLRRTKPSMVPHFEFLKTVVKQGTPKFTMPSPAMLHARGDRDSIRKTYPDPDEFWADLTQCYREEIADLYKAGCRYLQIDDTTIAMFGDPKVQEHVPQAGRRPEEGRGDLRRGGERRDPRRARRHDGRDPHLPRQLQEHLARERQLRLRRRDRVLDHRRRRLLPRVRRRALGRLRAAALHPQGQARGARAGELQGSASWRKRMVSSGASRRRPSSCRSKTCASRRSAASPARTTATT